MTDTFTCPSCDEVFTKITSDHDAEAEYAKIFGEDLGEEAVAVCDECYREFMEWYKQQDKASIAH